jgi:hypothetical protein
LHLEQLRSQNIFITSKSVDTATIAKLLSVIKSDLDAGMLVTHRFRYSNILNA